MPSGHGDTSMPPRGSGPRWAMGSVPFSRGMTGYTAVSAVLLYWGHRNGLILGSPLVLTGLMAAFLAGSHERWHLFLGGGQLRNRLVLRLLIANGLAAVTIAYAGWSFLLPGWALLIVAVHIGWAGSGSWRTAAVITTVVTVATQAAVHVGLVASIVPVVHSDVAAALALSLALTAVNNIGVSAARAEAATERLHRAEARFRALVQNSSDVVTVLDADGRLTLVSPAVRHVTGWEVAEWLGTDRLRLVHPDDEPGVRAALAVLVGAGDGEELRLEVRSRHRDGSWRWHEITMRGLLADPAVGGIVCNERDVSDRRSHQEQLAHAAAHDALTGLPNRTEMRRRLTDALPAAVPGHLVALLYIDLDGFKNVNDRHGHTTGDALLVATADRLREGLGPLDVLSRLGGDEFAAVLIDVPNTAAVEERVAELTAAMGRPFDLDGRSVTVGASIGWAATETATTDPQWLIEQADTTMYQVKREVSAIGTGAR